MEHEFIFQLQRKKDKLNIINLEKSLKQTSFLLLAHMFHPFPPHTLYLSF